MTRLRASIASLFVQLLAGCSDGMAPRFSDDSGAPDAVTAMCTSNAQCDDSVACTNDVCVVGGTCEHIPNGPMCVPTPRCMRSADCDDRVPCTRDSCLVDGTCGHTAQNDMCQMGQTCDLMRGCGGGMAGTCRTAADCTDTFDCTVETCGADGRCSFTAQNARCTAPQVCRVGMGCISERACSSDADCDDRMRCNGVERCVEFGCRAGTAVTCEDMNACTIDRCAETGPMCSNAPNPACMGSVRSGIFNVATPASFSCAGGQVAVSIQRFLFSVSGANLTVTPTPSGPGMMGTIMGATFSVRAMVGDPAMFGVCVENYQLDGRFTDANQFTGTYTISFEPALLCALAGCSGRTFPIQGTAAM